MKPFLFKTLLFLSILISAFWLLGKLDNIDRSQSTNLNIIKLQNKSKFDSLDILFIGNSYTYSGIIPSYFDSLGLKTFNLGIATAGPYFYDLIINDYINSTREKPKTIFILVSPLTFSKVADNFVSYPIHRYLTPPLSNEKVAIKYDLNKDYLGLQKRSLLKGLSNIAGLEQSKDNSSHDLSQHKGFYPSTEVNSEETEKATKHLYFKLKSDNFDKEKFTYLLNFSKKLKAEGIEVVFYELGYNKLEDYFNPSFLSSYKSSLEDISGEFLFLTNDLTLTNRYYRNIDHLNSAGAKVSTKQLIEKMASNEALMRKFQKGKATAVSN